MRHIWVMVWVAACTHAHDPGPSGEPDASASVCGDGTCSAGETLAACPEDCARCGDLVCSPTESATTCPADCAQCGDGVCNHGETLANCPADCSVCGDAMCTGAETIASCAGDCSQCGDGMCTGPETLATCAQDCGAGLHLVNASTYSIAYLYSWPCGTSSEGPDILGASMVAPNGSFDVHAIPPGCYNFRAYTLNDAQSWTHADTQFTAGVTFTWTVTN